MSVGLTLLSIKTSQKFPLNEKLEPDLFHYDKHPNIALAATTGFLAIRPGYEHLNKKIVRDPLIKRVGRKPTKSLKTTQFASCYSLGIIGPSGRVFICKIFVKNSGSINNIVGCDQWLIDEVCRIIEDVVNTVKPGIEFKITGGKFDLKNFTAKLDLKKFAGHLSIPERPYKPSRNDKGPYASIILNVYNLRRLLSTNDFFRIPIREKSYLAMIYCQDNNDLQFVFEPTDSRRKYRVYIYHNGTISIKGGIDLDVQQQVVVFLENMVRLWATIVVQVGFRTIKVKEREEFSADIGWENANTVPLSYEFPSLL